MTELVQRQTLINIKATERSEGAYTDVVSCWMGREWEYSNACIINRVKPFKRLLVVSLMTDLLNSVDLINQAQSHKKHDAYSWINSKIV